MECCNANPERVLNYHRRGQKRLPGIDGIANGIRLKKTVIDGRQSISVFLWRGHQSKPLTPSGQTILHSEHDESQNDVGVWVRGWKRVLLFLIPSREEIRRASNWWY